MNKTTKHCAHCGATKPIAKLMPWPIHCGYRMEEERICLDCFNDLFFACQDCGEIIDVDAVYFLNTTNLCYSCWSAHGRWEPEQICFPGEAKKLGSTRAFGVELETSDCSGYETLKDKTCFGAKQDGSIDGMEFVSPILKGDAGLAEVYKFCQFAKKLKFKVNKDCGYHIHIDMRDTSEITRQRIAYAYSLAFDLWGSLVNRDRLNNNFCETPHYDSTFVRACRDFDDTFVDASRYKFINWRAYRDHGTLEIRGHHGTVKTLDVVNWVKAHLRFVDFVKDKSFDELNDLFGKGLPRARRNFRKIIGQQLSRFYSKKLRAAKKLRIFA